MTNKTELPAPSVVISLIPIFVVCIALFLSVFIYETKVHIPLFLGAITAGIIGYIHGFSWKFIQSGYISSISRAIPSLLILLIIGMLISVWVASGIVPAIIYYGFDILVPSIYLPSIFIVCCFMSVITGSSWTTIGTFGVAAIGISQGLQIPPPAAAGAIVSGAFFGDKLSPMSDSTNLTPSVLGVNLYSHIKHMLYTTGPSFIISLIMYVILGLFLVEGSSDTAFISKYQKEIIKHFTFSGWLFLPPVIVIILIAFKIPAIPSLVTGVLLGGVMQLFIQDKSMGDFFNILYNGVHLSTGLEEVDKLLSRGGMSSMYSVVALAILSLAFGGIMNRCKMLESIVKKMTVLVDSRGHLIITTLLTSIFINIFSANQYLAVIIPGQMYESSYKKLKLSLKNLTRALESGGTLTAPLIPWNSSGAFIYSVTSIYPFAFAPYAFICWLTPIITGIFGYINITMEKED
ncbi:Na+/H+ antiporter NhaC [Alkaliphilus pronyensis]|uniref:Na+/H+ antiporter NhaC n=1 Tax=Alkaliphilus pronyensis TaxID=1482732 RepID=UPI00186573C9|nr:Na+/H+ antiporter NhaC [Alkaliphilus pronyensis]